MDARPAGRVGIGQRAPRAVGTVRSWLVAEAILGTGDRATVHPRDRLPQGVVAWYRGDPGAPVVYFDARSEADFARFKGEVKGAIVLTAPATVVTAHFEPLGNRKTDSELLELADAPEPAARGFGRRGQGQPGQEGQGPGQRQGRAQAGARPTGRRAASPAQGGSR